jgi:hypothetical protein
MRRLATESAKSCSTEIQYGAVGEHRLLWEDFKRMEEANQALQEIFKAGQAEALTEREAARRTADISAAKRQDAGTQAGDDNVEVIRMKDEIRHLKERNMELKADLEGERKAQRQAEKDKIPEYVAAGARAHAKAKEEFYQEVRTLNIEEIRYLQRILTGELCTLQRGCPSATDKKCYI